MGRPTYHSTDWRQQADRHTLLEDPVLAVHQIGVLGLPGGPPPGIDQALVYTTREGGFEVFHPPHRPRRVLRRYTAMYEVDLGIHPVRTRIALPSSQDAHEFDATVELDWQVTDPIRFVRSGHRNVPRLLLGELEEAARPATRGFAITDSAGAETAVTAALRDGKPLGEQAGLRAVWSVRLRRDQENIAHARRLQAIEHATAEEILAQQSGAAADLEKAAREEAQHRHRLAMQKYEAQRIDFYREYLGAGGVDAWALHVAQHPEDSAKAMQSLRDDQRERLRAQMSLIKEMLNKTGTEPFELEGPRQRALDAFNAVFGHVTDEPDVEKPAGPAARDAVAEPGSPPLPPQPTAADLSAWLPPLPPLPPEPPASSSTSR
ncbi:MULTISPECIES: hypothetical protein [Streptomyces]|uniref:hypothetical protein n=1 Tax=Streptomyces TaxID=1883 RepID=UPI001679315E|nr:MULTISPECIES: hypothetical protein [Streptomyces]MBD3577192.1 hypothetical protein [Streptomyces sp. KD18]GGS86690.1 hypothetical protein GCM10010286_09200 [Streptomyces toxytricini]